MDRTKGRSAKGGKRRAQKCVFTDARKPYVAKLIIPAVVHITPRSEPINCGGKLFYKKKQKMLTQLKSKFYYFSYTLAITA